MTSTPTSVVFPPPSIVPSPGVPSSPSTNLPNNAKGSQVLWGSRVLIQHVQSAQCPDIDNNTWLNTISLSNNIMAPITTTTLTCLPSVWYILPYLSVTPTPYVRSGDLIRLARTATTITVVSPVGSTIQSIPMCSGSVPVVVSVPTNTNADYWSMKGVNVVAGTPLVFGISVTFNSINALETLSVCQPTTRCDRPLVVGRPSAPDQWTIS